VDKNHGSRRAKKGAKAPNLKIKKGGGKLKEGIGNREKGILNEETQISILKLGKEGGRGEHPKEIRGSRNKNSYGQDQKSGKAKQPLCTRTGNQKKKKKQ